MVVVLPPFKPEILEPSAGSVLVVGPSPHRLYGEDHEYYDQLGRDPLQQSRVWLVADADERVRKLQEVLERYTKQRHRRKMLARVTERGDEALVRCLLEAGVTVHPAELETQDAQNTTVEEVAMSDDESGDETDRSGASTDGKSVATDATEHDIDVAVEGDGAEYDENGIPDEVDLSIAPVHIAARKGHIGCVKIFIREGNVSIDARDEFGRTPFLVAASFGQKETMRYLLTEGADPTVTADPENTFIRRRLGDYAGANALEWAATHGDVEMLLMLLDHVHGSAEERSPEAGQGNGLLVTPLAIRGAAGAGRNLEALTLLLERGGYPMEGRGGKTKAELLTNDERQAIVDATPDAMEFGDLGSLKVILSYQYPTDAEGNLLPFNIPFCLQKPFTYGTYNAVGVCNSPEKFEFMASFGVREHATMSLDDVPVDQTLHIQHLMDRAAEAGSLECVSLLVDRYGAQPDGHRLGCGQKPLFTAAAGNHTALVRHLLEAHCADIHRGNGRYATGPTALWIAVRLDALDSVALLLGHGGPVDHVDAEVRGAVLDGPMDALLVADKDDRRRTRTRLLAGESACAVIERWSADWQTLNPPYVRLRLDAGDRPWLDRLQLRRSDEELREEGEVGRWLDRDEEMTEDEDDVPDAKRVMADIPTVKAREQELETDDDRIPEWEPQLVLMV